MRTRLDRLSGVRGRLHTTSGYRRWRSPTSVVIRGNLIDFIFRDEATRLASGLTTGFTLYLGDQVIFRPVNPPTAFGQGDNLVVSQRVEVVL